jgi:hypothetical protein
MQSHQFFFSFLRFIFYQPLQTQRAIWKKSVAGHEVKIPVIVFWGSDTVVVGCLNKRT